MAKTPRSFEQLTIAKYLLNWTMLIVPVAFITGSLVAFFLWMLDAVTTFRWQHLWLIFLLPPAGVLIVLIYSNLGKSADAGNNLIIDEIHKPGGGVPARMTPLVLFATILTHLFGGSAGREGTAIQMGGSMASLLSKWYKLKHTEKRILLMCGMAAGFGAVFGTPVAGAVFAMEVLAIGRIRYDALIPCLIAAMLANFTCAAYGIAHTQYHIRFIQNDLRLFSFLSFNIWLLLKVILAGCIFGLASFCFAETCELIKRKSRQYLKPGWMIPIAGGILVVAISYAIGSFDYLGLGVYHPQGGVSILSSFEEGGAAPMSWFWKLLLTAITLGTGFKGGEVTPLFFIGAALGNVLAMLSGAPVDFFAALGFVAVFAGATNTPIASTLMAVELFGSSHVVYFAVACFTAYYFSGHAGIYSSQKIAVPKRQTGDHKETE